MSRPSPATAAALVPIRPEGTAGRPRATRRPRRTGRLARWVRPWRRSPATTAYLATLLIVYGLTNHVLSHRQWLSVLRATSTNVTNLEHHPVRALAASALFIATPLFSVDTALTAGLGIAGCMAWVERRSGTANAVLTFAAGHVGATLLTWPVINAGIGAQLYRPEVRGTLDVGVSYGSIAMTAAVVRYLPRWAAPLWVGGGVAYLLWVATWSGPLPDFTTVGHLFAIGIGLIAAAFAPVGPAVRRLHGSPSPNDYGETPKGTVRAPRDWNGLTGEEPSVSAASRRDRSAGGRRLLVNAAIRIRPGR